MQVFTTETLSPIVHGEFQSCGNYMRKVLFTLASELGHLRRLSTPPVVSRMQFNCDRASFSVNVSEKFIQGLLEFLLVGLEVRIDK